MRDQRNASRRISDHAIAQRSLVLTVLSKDHDERWTRAELEQELHDVQLPVIADALERLRDGEVVELSGEQVRATRCARHLNDLGMVCI
jgi:hypothetical protein